MGLGTLHEMTLRTSRTHVYGGVWRRIPRDPTADGCSSRYRQIGATHDFMRLGSRRQPVFIFLRPWMEGMRAQVCPWRQLSVSGVVADSSAVPLIRKVQRANIPMEIAEGIHRITGTTECTRPSSAKVPSLYSSSASRRRNENA